MKLLILTPIFPPEPGGPAKYTSEIMSRLSDWDIEVITFTNDIAIKHQRNVTFISTHHSSIVRQFSFFIQGLFKGKGADTILILEPLVVGLCGLLVSTILRKKLICKYVGDPSWEHARFNFPKTKDLKSYLLDKSRRTDWRYLLTKLVLFNSRSIIVPSMYMKKLLIDCYGIGPSKLKVIYNSVDIRSGKQIKFSRSLVYCGRLVNWKNLDLILDALRIVKQKYKDFTFTVVGSGPEEKKLKDMTKNLELLSNVNFIPNVAPEEALSFMKKSQAVILFSDYEGLSHMLLEGMSVGCLTIASDIDGNNEVIKNEHNGYLVEPRNIYALAKIIIKVFSGSNHNQFIDNARKTLQDKFSWQANLHLLKEVLTEKND